MTLPAVAIIGRPNVGKSTLLNRFLGRRTAIVEERPGVTRDRAEHLVEWNGREFRVVDTGGWQSRTDDPMGEAIRLQAESAIAAADVAVMICDVSVGVTAEDLGTAERLRASATPVVLAVNKVDDAKAEPDVSEFWSLGLGEPLPVSALHGRRSGDLLDAIVELLPPPESADQSDPGAVASIAIVGRPNVGKSTLFNRLVGSERAIVHDAPGTTRDAVDTQVDLEGVGYRFVDTAGLRRRSRVDTRTEYYSRVRAIHALERADLALLVIDATEGVTFADQKVADEIVRTGRAAIILLNKWDLLRGDERLEAARQLDEELGFMHWAPRLRISARTGANVQRLAESIEATLEAFRLRISTRDLMKVIEAAQQRHPPPLVGGAPTRIRYATQIHTEPPTVAAFSNRKISDDYLRYLERSLRETFSLDGTPVRLKVRLRKPKRNK